MGSSLKTLEGFFEREKYSLALRSFGKAPVKVVLSSQLSVTPGFRCCA